MFLGKDEMMMSEMTSEKNKRLFIIVSDAMMQCANKSRKLKSVKERRREGNY